MNSMTPSEKKIVLACVVGLVLLIVVMGHYGLSDMIAVEEGWAH